MKTPIPQLAYRLTVVVPASQLALIVDTLKEFKIQGIEPVESSEPSTPQRVRKAFDPTSKLGAIESTVLEHMRKSAGSLWKYSEFATVLKQGGFSPNSAAAALSRLSRRGLVEHKGKNMYVLKKEGNSHGNT
jgi:hypothetical protein